MEAWGWEGRQMEPWPPRRSVTPWDSHAAPGIGPGDAPNSHNPSQWWWLLVTRHNSTPALHQNHGTCHPTAILGQGSFPEELPCAQRDMVLGRSPAKERMHNASKSPMSSSFVERRMEPTKDDTSTLTLSQETRGPETNHLE